MAHDYVALRFGGATRRACVRELCGFDEVSVHDSLTSTAIRTLDRLLVDQPACLTPGSGAALSAFDRDRVLAAVYRRAFGDRIDGTLTCGVCANRFDMHFSLGDLDRAIGTAPPEWEVGPDGYIRTPDGAVFRLPSGREECAAAALPPEQAQASLAGAVVDPASRPLSVDELEALCERVAPLIDLVLDAPCAECGATQHVRFSLQTFLLESLMNERRRLVGEVHRLAVAYGWRRDDILELPRAARRQHLELIDGDGARRQGGWR